MDFIVKDLMIRLLPTTGISPVAASCGGCTDCSSCSSNTRILDLGDIRTLPVSPFVLSLLKHQLREALSVVEAKERAVAESLRPTTAADIEALQTHLTAALKELQNTKPQS